MPKYQFEEDQTLVGLRDTLFLMLRLQLVKNNTLESINKVLNIAYTAGKVNGSESTISRLRPRAARQEPVEDDYC